MRNGHEDGNSRNPLIYSSIVLIIIIIGEISKKRKERERENKKEVNK